MSKPGKPGSTRDHIVPRMYLRRFGIPKSGGHQLTVTTVDQSTSFPASVNKVAVEEGFYWGTTPDGIPHHDMEDLLTKIEAAATPAFRNLLDRGQRRTDDALPTLPIRADVRLAIAWWIAAQLLRTTRQRERLLELYEEPVAVPAQFKADAHLEYIIEMIAPIAGVIMRRPWGFGITSLCLITSDTPVLVLNGQDEHDQLTAVSFWDIYLPLDAHRLLFLPGHTHRGNPRVSVDHRFHLPGGVALPLNDLQVATATRHIFSHPEHDLWKKHLNPHPRVGPRSPAGDEFGGIVLQYDALPHGDGVERRWLDTHPGPEEPSEEPSEPEDDRDPLEAAKGLATRLEKAQDTYRSLGRPPTQTADRATSTDVPGQRRFG